MKDAITQLWWNVSAGSRLAVFRPVSQEEFRISPGQLLLLVVLDLLLTFCFDWLENLPAPVFYQYGLAYLGFNAAMLLTATSIVALWLSRTVAPLNMAVMVFSSLPFLSLIYNIIILFSGFLPDETIHLRVWIYALLLIWVFSVIARPAWLGHTSTKLRIIKVPALYAIVWFIPAAQFASNSVFWYSENSDGGTDEYAGYRDLDVEAVYYRQHDILTRTLHDLHPERPGTDDLYFVGFAGYAYQDVFLKEIRYARKMFDDRFDTGGRSLIMANHLSTLESLPLASRSNLQSTLKYIGERMDRENDVLVMFLTSHGSRKSLSVDFWTLQLNNLTPQQLRSDLDAAGIRWRVIMVSACYSGTFIEALRDPYTMVMTAAASDRTSFGCGNDSEMTYFGEALLKHQLQYSHSFDDAFARAAAEISEREQAEKRKSSNPQIYIGTEIKVKLADLADVLKARMEGKRTESDFALSPYPGPMGAN